MCIDSYIYIIACHLFIVIYWLYITIFSWYIIGAATSPVVGVAGAARSSGYHLEEVMATMDMGFN